VISRRDKQMLKQLGKLRENRMHVAEFAVVKARHAAEEAAKDAEQAKQELTRTREWCRMAYVRVNASLSGRGSITHAVLTKWKHRRQQIRAKLDAAQERVERMAEARTKKEEELRQSKDKHRATVMDIERLKLLQENME
jgi:hypothetical protein